jgi:hypothetical protein
MPSETYLKLCSYSCILSRAVKRVGKWLQQIAHLYIFKLAEKKMIMSQQQVTTATTRSKLLQRLLHVLL